MISLRSFAMLMAILTTLLLSIGLSRLKQRDIPLYEQIQFRSKTAAIIADLTEELREPEGCDPIFAGQRISPSQLNHPTLPASSDPDVLVEDMELAVGQPDMKLKIKELDPYLTRYPASLRFLFRSMDGQIRVNWRQSKVDKNDLGIKFYLWLDPAGKIISCHGPESAAAVCNLTNGFYFNHQCHPTLRAVLVSATDPLKEPGFGTCRFGGIRQKGKCGQMSAAISVSRSCISGRCLSESELCQQCE